MNALRDPYGRVIDSLRILVTLNCNYNCIFCHREGLQGFPREELTPDDYGFLAEVASKLGMLFYKISGGEPLLRPDIVEIVSELRPHAREISLVTNGYLLRKYASRLASAGLDRVNVSLHALNEKLYRYITNAHASPREVIAGIDEALQYGIKVKLNFLAMKSNLSEFFSLLEFAELRGLDVNLIELMPLGVPVEVFSSEHVPLKRILSFLEEKSVAKYYRELQNRPVYVLSSGIKVEVVIGFENPLFCSKCSRIRLTPDGRLKPCLYVENLYVNALEAIKARDKVGLIKAFHEVIQLRKPYFDLKGAFSCQQKWSI